MRMRIPGGGRVWAVRLLYFRVGDVGESALAARGPPSVLNVMVQFGNVSFDQKYQRAQVYSCI